VGSLEKNLSTFGQMLFSFYTWKTEKAGFYETSVYVYQTAWRYIPEDSNLYIHYCGKFKSRTYNQTYSAH